MQYIIEHYGHEGSPRETDLADINELNRLVFQQEPMTEEYFEDFLENPMLIYVVARHPETRRIVGKWSWYVIPLDHGGTDAIKGWTEQVVVHPKHEGHGIGRRMHKKAVAVARELGCTFEDLSSSKEPAQKFYLRLGFEERVSKLFRYKI